MGTSTSSDSYLEKAILALGFKNPMDFFLRFAVPIIASVIIFFFVTIYVLTGLPKVIPYVVLVAGFGFVVIYPIIIYESKKTDINQNLHLFITYAGTISTLGIQRNVMFRKLAEKKHLFGEISAVAQKINYFAKAWNLGYAQTCHRISRVVPSDILGDFLDRFALMLDLGQDHKIFIREEQDAVMEDFAVDYKKSLTGVTTIQDIFTSLTMALGFMMSIGLLMPLISGTPIDTVVKFALLALVIMDFIMLGFAKMYIPEDRILFDGDNRSPGYVKAMKYTYILVPVSTFLMLFMFFLGFLPFLVNVAIGISPLMFVGLLAQQEENRVVKIDRIFPSFIRALGSITNIKSGAVMSSISALRVHDFGPMNELMLGLYRRLKTGNDKFKSWELFSKESGSYLIHQFSTIFSESVYIGGDAELIGEIVSENFVKILSLRRLRLQISSGVRGSLYGSLVGFTLSAYMAAELTQILAKLFSQPSNSMGGNDQLAGILAGIAPTSALEINVEMIAMYIGIMVIIHSIVSALIIKITDGGSMYATFFDFVLMVWLGTVISVVLPWGIKLMLPGLAGSTLT